MLASLVRYRSFIWRHAAADLRHRYAGTGLGLAWNVVHPLAVIAIYSAVFTTVFPTPAEPGGGRLPYTFYLCSGFFPWLAFSDCVTRGTAAFVANAAYLKKLPIPEPVFVAQSAATTATLGLAVELRPAPGRRRWRWETGPAWTWLLLPLPLLASQWLGLRPRAAPGHGERLLPRRRRVGRHRPATDVLDRPDRLPAGPRAAAGWQPSCCGTTRWSPALSAVRRPVPRPGDSVTAVDDVAGDVYAWPLAVTTAVAYAVLAKLGPEIRDVI